MIRTNFELWLVIHVVYIFTRHYWKHIWRTFGIGCEILKLILFGIYISRVRCQFTPRWLVEFRSSAGRNRWCAERASDRRFAAIPLRRVHSSPGIWGDGLLHPRDILLVIPVFHSSAMVGEPSIYCCHLTLVPQNFKMVGGPKPKPRSAETQVCAFVTSLGWVNALQLRDGQRVAR